MFLKIVLSVLFLLLIAFENKDAGNKGLPDLSDLYKALNISGKSLSKIVVEEREERY